MAISEILSIVFGTGGAASLAAFLKLWRQRKDAFDRARREHIEDLAKWRTELQDTVHELQALVEYYRSVSADYAWQLRQNGIQPMTSAVKPGTSAN
ncbi:hypothetical protein SMD11_1263 [Streptomyces albireticuli]|uniref:Uncharacterized protein n=1 Tax=Streptomyces albireticuli TaxID=1940 RepID=A0A1Z2KY04_9ACTN|nr:hypothetical protein [Streptomyces albireticuli]ARZ66924.1 hypothetical protein SMD11_1263 [Streptomyces albireticuli]